MMKPITGQYECVHRSGVGLDYFTSRIDRLTLLGNGRFVLVSQDRSRIANAAQTLLSGQQANMAAAPETRREGNYFFQDKTLTLRFDDGTQEQGQFSWNGDGVQIGQAFFNKVSDSTLLPPTHRLKQNMDDIAKGLKIAGAIGGMAVKAAKTIHDTLQPAQEPGSSQAPAQGPVPSPSPAQNQGSAAYAPPTQGPAPYSPPPAPGQGPPSYAPPPQSYTPPQPPPEAVPHGGAETVFCDQCGARVRPGKRFCNQCGARLP